MILLQLRWNWNYWESKLIHPAQLFLVGCRGSSSGLVEQKMRRQRMQQQRQLRSMFEWQADGPIKFRWILIGCQRFLSSIKPLWKWSWLYHSPLSLLSGAVRWNPPSNQVRVIVETMYIFFLNSLSLHRRCCCRQKPSFVTEIRLCPGNTKSHNYRSRYVGRRRYVDITAVALTTARPGLPLPFQPPHPTFVSELVN